MKTLFGGKTDFSQGFSIHSAESLVKTASEAGYDSIAVADIGGINALPLLEKAAKPKGMKIIIGATIRIVDDLRWRKAKKGEGKKAPNPFWYAKVYVKNEQGLKDLMALLSLSNDPEHFYMQAQIDFKELLETLDMGNVIVTTGDFSSAFSHKDYENIAQELKASHRASQTFAEIVPDVNQFFDQVSIRAIESGMNTIVSRPVMYPEGKHEIRDTMGAILGRQTNDSPFALKFDHTMSCRTLPDLIEHCANQRQRIINTGQGNYASSSWKDALRNAQRFTDAIEYKFQPMPVSLPFLSSNPFESLVKLSMAGWEKRIKNEVLGFKPEPHKLPLYKERMRYELKILKQMGFENYFLLVSNIVDWSKRNDIMVGPGRGSAGGSLVSFLLGITDIDPIRFGLIFERFINPERLDLPDIDIDFMSERKSDVHDYLTETWGEKYVAGISNYGVLKSSSALRSVGKAHGMKEHELKATTFVPKDSGEPVPLEEAKGMVPELEAFSLANPKVWEEASDLQGVFRSYGRHAAGVVVSGTPLTERAVVETRHEHQTLSWDKRIVESFGLIKLDILGLSNLDALAAAKKYVHELTGEDIVYTDIPLDDPKVYQAFSRGETVGVFQFESGGMRKLLKELAFGGDLTFEDIVAANALFRPGPMESGLMDRYISIKQGTERPDYPHSSMIPALEETHSVLVFQEQVMKIARDLSGFTFAEADHLRKAMGKKDPAEMAKMRDGFVEGAVKHSGFVESAATDLFDQIEKFAGYGFNKSHAVEYSVISYWCMYMKVHHPAAFFAACLGKLNEDKRPGLVKDAADYGIKIMPPDLNKSSGRFEIERSGDDYLLYAPFSTIKGVSDRGAAAIVKAKEEHGVPFANLDDFIEAVEKRVCNTRVRASMESVGTFASIIPGSIPADSPERLRDQKELLPGLMSSAVKAKRKVMKSEDSIKEILQALADTSMAAEAIGQNQLIMPKLGSDPKLMIVTDYPNYSETEDLQMGAGEASEALIKALKKSKLGLKDVHLTALVKCPKEKGQDITNEMIRVYGECLQKEIEILKPPVILSLGSKNARFFIPDLRGKWDENCGKDFYIKDTDATLILGMAPGMIYFDKSKQKILDKLIEQVAVLIK